MITRNPVAALDSSLSRAIGRDLSPKCQGSTRKSMTADDCTIVMFTQAWRRSALTRDVAPAEDHAFEADTIVICGPAGDACVYVSGDLLYRVAHPNRRFFLDVAAQAMRPETMHAIYEGRDSADLEALDYEVAATLARWRGAVHMLDDDERRRARRLLRQMVEEMDA